MTVLILDFDGVVNSSTSEKYLEKVSERTGWSDTQYHEIGVHKFISHDIRFAPELVDRINQWSSIEGNRVYWASSWDENTGFLTELGLKSFPYLDTSQPNDWDATGEWFAGKIGSAYHGLETLFGEGEKVIWVDDDFKDFPNVVKRLEDTIKGISIFSPDLEVGITRDMWETISKI